jgi:hypothetical protein
MNAEVFEQTMRSFLRQMPFESFVVELEEGEDILIDDPHAVALGGGGSGGAGYIGPKDIYMFSAEQVRDIRGAHQTQGGRI